MNCETIKQNVGIRTVLESFNIFPVKENRKTAFYFALDREEKIPSLSVDFVKNKAFDFGTGKSYDVISIVQQMNQCSVSDALKYLSAFVFSSQNEFLDTEVKAQFDYKVLEIKEIEHPALLQYLKSRKVFEQKHLVSEIHYELNEKKYFGINFQNDSGGFEIRNPYSKICLGKKDITFIQSEQNANNEIVIFEGFFDYLTFRNLEKSDNPTFDFLILNSTAMLFKAEERLKKYETISLFLDNDANGKSVKARIQNQYKNVEDCSLIYHDFKDLNEWFCEKEANTLSP
ncbi:toprim domain-containing protein [Chryseobacterium sp. RR2-3-20]|jgi:5S rRNA maturation endonuclease (ribonuclease M5)|uniref:toprim domain-containing protein n=1 Tax=Chryseobacterium sp. RR2-3-20 TaxID=2787626 RepID=UPI001AE0C6DA|nr:toprim domain-containing protein [Chryseobacterium sp. RR2-3-20]